MGSDRPATFPYISRVLLDNWNIYGGLNPDAIIDTSFYLESSFDTDPGINFENLVKNASHFYLDVVWDYKLVSEEKKQKFMAEHVEHIKFADIRAKTMTMSDKKRQDILNTIVSQGREEMLESIKKDGIEHPITYYRQGTAWIALEGKRREMLAHAFNLETIPIFVLEKVSGVEPRPGWWMTFWEFFDTLKRSAELCQSRK